MTAMEMWSLKSYFGMALSTNKMTHRLFLVFALLLNLSVYGQMKPDEEFAYFHERYPDDVAVYLRNNETVDFRVQGDSIVTTIEVYEELLHLGENTTRYASGNVISSSFYKISELEAYTLIPNKKKYVRLDVNEFKESYDKDTYVFFDDSKVTTFTFPGVQKGVKTILKYKKTITDARMTPMYYIATHLPIHAASYKVTHDEKIIIEPRIFNDEAVDLIRKTQKLSNGRTRLTFEASNVKQIKFDYSAPAYSYLTTSVYCPVSSYTTSSGISIDLLASAESLHKWYRTFLSKILDQDEEVAHIVASIISTDDTEWDKINKIYQWVQSNIKYIAFEDGMRGLIPHSGSYVLSKRYGDCKDMASTIVALLREADIEAYYTWVGSRDLPFKYSETPSPVVDNHMIATVIVEDKIYYLDATGQYTPISLPTSMIQGKECLISLGPNKHRIETIPVVPKEQNMMIDSVNIRLDKGKVIGEGKASFTGYAKVFNTYKLVKANQNSVEDYIQRLLSKGSNKFRVEDFSIDNLERISSPIDIAYKFNIADYYRRIGDDIYFNLVMDRTYTDGLLDGREVPLENEYKYINRNVVKLTIPEGYSLGDLPKDEMAQNEHFGYSIKYKKENNEVIASKEFYLDFLVLYPQNFDDWNQIINKYAKACRKAVVLSKQPN